MSEIKKKKNLKPSVKRWGKLILKICTIIAVLAVLTQYVFGFFYVRGNYMFPSVKDGDLLMTYRYDEIVKNDLVVYKQGNTKKVGRVVAMEGDTVAFTTDGELLVNGNVANEEIFYATTEVTKAGIRYPYTVPDGELFVLNDYRSLDSEDSRTFKSIKTEDVQGKVFMQFRRRGF